MPITEAAHQFFDALDFHDLAALERILSDDFQYSGNVTQVLDKRGTLALYQAYFTAFSDFEFHFNDAQQKGPSLRVKYQISGTHDGILDLTPLGIAVGVEPTDQTISLPESASEISFNESNQVTAMVMHQAEGASLADMLSQLGIEMPPLG